MSTILPSEKYISDLFAAKMMTYIELLAFTHRHASTCPCAYCDERKSREIKQEK